MLTGWANASAQTWDEWFSQKKTQKKYLAQQIVALQAYIGFAKKGYEIAQKGLGTISNLKNGELNLYRDFFGGLKGVNPAIKNYARVADLLALQTKILLAYRRDYTALKDHPGAVNNELDYIKRVYERVLKDCGNAVDELITITASNKLQLTDDQRLERIDRLYHDMQQRYAFTESFGAEALLLQRSRTADEKTAHDVKLWYKIP